jgi:hypothetical protein
VSAVVGCSHGEGATRLARATAAMRIAATGSTIAAGLVGAECPGVLAWSELVVGVRTWSRLA